MKEKEAQKIIGGVREKKSSRKINKQSINVKFINDKILKFIKNEN